MFGILTDKFEGVFRRLRGLGKISESNVADALRDVRLALLEADVDFTVTRDFLAAVKEKALGQEVLKSVTPGQQLVKIFHDEITALLGGEEVPLNLTPPARIMMVGLNGAGKTTTSAKLAYKLKKEGKKPVLVALDLYRPAAIEQLATLAGEVDVPVFKPEPGEKNVLKAAKAAVAWLETQGANVVIFDTAGRQEVDEALIQELKDVRKFLNPGEVLLVADSATGQQAVSVAKTFHEAVGVTGIVLTKLDGDARGGAALSMRRVTQQPIKFAGVGEKMNQLDVFVPDRMAQRILGMGDIVGLVEQAAEAIDEADAMKMMERMTSSDFDFNDFLGQLKMMKKLTSGAGGMMGLLSLLPGVGSKIKEMKGQVDDKKLTHIEALILSMTPKERKRPEILNAKRRARIAAGAGRSVNELNQMLSQFGDMRKLMRNPGKMGAMAKMMGAMGGPGGGAGGGGFPGLGGLGGGGMPDFSKLGGFPGMGGGKHSGGSGGGGSKFGSMGRPGGGKRKK
ncbi:MAG: signal recognition particle protein [Verrucomicrobiota bacterium]